ncbi:MAG: hypothetical protein AAF705_13565 [Bacteroidota bacterium]
MKSKKRFLAYACVMLFFIGCKGNQLIPDRTIVSVKIIDQSTSKFDHYYELQFKAKNYQGYILLEKSKKETFEGLMKQKDEYVALKLCDVKSFKTDDIDVVIRGPYIDNYTETVVVNGKEIVAADFSDRAKDKYYMICDH